MDTPKTVTTRESVSELDEIKVLNTGCGCDGSCGCGCGCDGGCTGESR